MFTTPGGRARSSSPRQSPRAPLAGLAFDKVHLKYLAEGKLRITRTEREAGGAVQWRVDRARPILPPGQTAESSPGTGKLVSVC